MSEFKSEANANLGPNNIYNKIQQNKKEGRRNNNGYDYANQRYYAKSNRFFGVLGGILKNMKANPGKIATIGIALFGTFFNSLPNVNTQAAAIGEKEITVSANGEIKTDTKTNDQFSNSESVTLEDKDCKTDGKDLGNIEDTETHTDRKKEATPPPGTPPRKYERPPTPSVDTSGADYSKTELKDGEKGKIGKEGVEFKYTKDGESQARTQFVEFTNKTTGSYKQEAVIDGQKVVINYNVKTSETPVVTSTETINGEKWTVTQSSKKIEFTNVKAFNASETCTVGSSTINGNIKVETTTSKSIDSEYLADGKWSAKSEYRDGKFLGIKITFSNGETVFVNKGDKEFYLYDKTTGKNVTIEITNFSGQDVKEGDTSFTNSLKLVQKDIQPITETYTATAKITEKELSSLDKPISISELGITMQFDQASKRFYFNSDGGVKTYVKDGNIVTVDGVQLEIVSVSGTGNNVSAVLERIQKNPLEKEETNTPIFLGAGNWGELKVADVASYQLGTGEKTIIFKNSAGQEINRVPHQNGTYPSILFGDKAATIVVDGNTVRVEGAIITKDEAVTDEGEVEIPIEEGKEEGEGENVEVFPPINTQNPASQPEQTPNTQQNPASNEGANLTNPTTPEQNNQNVAGEKIANPNLVVEQPKTVTNPVTETPQTPKEEVKPAETPAQSAPAVEQKQEAPKEEKVVIPPAEAKKVIPEVEVKTPAPVEKTETIKAVPPVSDTVGDKLPS